MKEETTEIADGLKGHPQDNPSKNRARELVTGFMSKLRERKSLHGNTEKKKQEADASIDKMREYVSRVRYGRIGELFAGQSVDIPTTNGTVRFLKEHPDWTTDRNSDRYDISLFSGEYVFHHPDMSVPGKAIPRNDDAEIIAGGKSHFFEHGQTFVDLGSGEAVALLQYYLDNLDKNPKAKYIGVDKGYKDSPPLDMQIAGVQLIHSDWGKLEDIPDNSVDRILSTQGAFMWGGIHINTDAPTSKNDIARTVTRIAKKGAILRFDCAENKRENNESIEILKEHGWEVKFEPETAVAVKL